ncbi:MAG: YbbR-like domain-containing protein [Calditrichaeota bacterium]|nr:MAG: YbbR-like domain-containing protein [Calditrichota bacterium]
MNLFFTKHLKIKLVCFGIALIFWFFIVTANDYTYEVEVRLQVTDIPVGKIIVNEIPQNVKIKLGGEGKYLFSLLFFEDATVKLDLSEVDVERELVIQPAMVDLPRLSQSMEVQSILHPTSVKIVLDDLINKKVPVSHQIICEPLDGYTLIGNIKLLPDSITLSGPKSRLVQIDKIETEPRSLTRQSSAFGGKIELKKFPLNSRIRMETIEINYSADVQKLLQFEFREIPIQVLNTPRRTEVIPLPSSATVTVIGGENYLLSLKPENFYLFVDYNNVHQANNNNSGEGLRIQYKTLSDVEIVEIFPPHVILEKRRINE